MKKKTIRNLLILLFFVGLIVGFLLPGDLKTITKVPLKAKIFNIPKNFGQLEHEGPYFKFSLLSETEIASVEILRVDERIPMHLHPDSDHYLYMHKGEARLVLGEVTKKVVAGDLIMIPEGMLHRVERSGDSPVEIISFSTPPFSKADTVYFRELE
jgi:quercetin dioxygenase-like cupin family protein